MVQCHSCNQTYDNKIALGTHLGRSDGCPDHELYHLLYLSDSYYDAICDYSGCGNKVEFMTLSEGFNGCCSLSCSAKKRSKSRTINTVSCTCDNCGKEEERMPCNISETNFCSKDCMYEYNKERFSGEGNPFYGETHDKEVKDVISEKAKGREPYWKGKELPDEIRNNMRRVKLEDLDEFEKYKTEVRRLTEPKKSAIKEKHDTCYYCGQDLSVLDSSNIHLDHKISITEGFNRDLSEEELADRKNLAVSCSDCNMEKRDKTEREYIGWLIKGDNCIDIQNLEKIVKSKSKVAHEFLDRINKACSKIAVEMDSLDIENKDVKQVLNRHTIKTLTEEV